MISHVIDNLKQKLNDNYLLLLFIFNTGIFWILTVVFFLVLVFNDGLPRFWGIYLIFRLIQDLTFSSVISLLGLGIVSFNRIIRFIFLFCISLLIYTWVVFDLAMFVNSGFRLEVSYLAHVLFLREMIVAGGINRAYIQLLVYALIVFLLTLVNSFLGCKIKSNMIQKKCCMALLILFFVVFLAYFCLPTEPVKQYGNSFVKTACDWLINRNSYISSPRIKQVFRDVFFDPNEICRYSEISDYPIFRYTFGYKGIKNFEVDISQGLPKHVFIIFIESARGVDCEFTGRTSKSMMPNLEKLASKGVAFSNFYAGGMGTVRGMFAALFGSLPISSNFTTQMNYYDTNLRGLSHVFLKNNYSTFFYNGFSLGFLRTYEFFHQQKFMNLFGFAEIQREMPFLQTPGEWGIHDKDLFRFCLNMTSRLNKSNCKTFNVILTDSSHGPYFIPGQDKTKASLLPLEERYRRAIGYADKQLAVFIENLKQSGIYQDSLIVILGDHGTLVENIGNGYCSLNDPAILVPLVILAPGRLKAPVVISENCGGVDLLPTIVDIMGFHNVENHSVGRSLMRKSDKDYPVFFFSNSGCNMAGIRYQQYKYIYELPTGKEQLYDLGKDIKEQHNIVNKYPDLAHRLNERIIDAIALSNSLGIQNKYAPSDKQKFIFKEFK